MKLSIIIPVKNEFPYICELLNELVPLNRTDTEIIMSDNYSNDGTWEYIEEFNDNIILTRPNKPCSPFENHLNALRHAKGEYVFPMGGDDIIKKSSIDVVIPYLKNDKIVIGQMECFDDKSGKRISLTNTQDEILGFFKEDKFSLTNYFQFVNYDQLFFCFALREHQQFLFDLKPNTMETFASWSNIFNLYGKTINNITLIPKPIFFKRYNKTGQNSFAEDQEYYATSYLKKTLNSISNSYLFFTMTKSIGGIIECLFANRYARGHYDKMDKKKIKKKLISFGPLLMLFLSPLLDFKRSIKNLITIS